MDGLLKFMTCGSVDDGKSTLIGHMLYDAKLLFADQKHALELESRVGSRAGKTDYSLLLDGLMAEREIRDNGSRELRLTWHTGIFQRRREVLLWRIRRGMRSIPETWRWGLPSQIWR